jgi:osmotically-inducible protein OsmY
MASTTPANPEHHMNIQSQFSQILRRSLIPVLAVLLCTVPPVSAQTKDTTSVDITRQVGGTPTLDTDVTKRVKSAIAMDNALSGFDIGVVTTKGDVHLTGSVDTQLQINQLVAITRDVEGVKSVKDELKLKP